MLSFDLEKIRKEPMAACPTQFERIDTIALHNSEMVLDAYK